MIDIVRVRPIGTDHRQTAKRGDRLNVAMCPRGRREKIDGEVGAKGTVFLSRSDRQHSLLPTVRFFAEVQPGAVWNVDAQYAGNFPYVRIRQAPVSLSARTPKHNAIHDGSNVSSKDYQRRERPAKPFNTWERHDGPTCPFEIALGRFPPLVTIPVLACVMYAVWQRVDGALGPMPSNNELSGILKTMVSIIFTIGLFGVILGRLRWANVGCEITVDQTHDIRTKKAPN